MRDCQLWVKGLGTWGRLGCLGRGGSICKSSEARLRSLGRHMEFCVAGAQEAVWGMGLENDQPFMDQIVGSGAVH